MKHNQPQSSCKLRCCREKFKAQLSELLKFADEISQQAAFPVNQFGLYDNCNRWLAQAKTLMTDSFTSDYFFNQMIAKSNNVIDNGPVSNLCQMVRLQAEYLRGLEKQINSIPVCFCCIILNSFKNLFGKKTMIFITLLTLFLGFTTNAWGYNFKNPYIYFNNADLEWNPAMLFVGHSSYSAGYNQTSNPLADTKLVYFHPDASWGDQTKFTIGNTSNWGAEGNSFDSRVGYMTHIGIQENYGFDENNTYYVAGTAGNSPTINVSYCASGHSALPKTTAKIQVQTRNSTGDYTTLSSGTAPATVTLQGTHMSGNGTTGRNTVTWDGEKEYNVVITGKVTTSYSSKDTKYQFDGWYVGGSQVGTGTSYEYYQSAATTVIAKFTRIKYTVTFDQQSGTSGTTSTTATYNQAMPSITIPQRDGYDFGGYYTGTNGSGTQYYNADGTSAKDCDLTADIQLYAKWTVSALTSPSIFGTTSYLVNQTITLTASATGIISSYQWYKNDVIISDATNATYTKENITTDDAGTYKCVMTNDAGSVNASVDVTIMANSYNITIARNESTYGTVSQGSINDVPEGTSISFGNTGALVVGTTSVTATPTTNTAQYTYAFTGWTSSDYTTGGTVTKEGTVTANFSCTLNTYTITFNANTGSGSMDAQTGVQYGISTKLNNMSGLSKTGYSFAGWAESANGEVAFADGANITIYGNKTLYAVWQAKTYTVTLNDNGGTGGDASVTATYNAAMPSATMPTKLGYKFLGYYDEETDGTQYYNADGTSAKNWDKDQNNVTLYAHWVKMYFFIEGRFHVANAERTPHGAVWTNTFSNAGWEDESRTIPMVWNSTAERYEVKTFATPKELSTELGTQGQKTPWFYIKASESATEMIGAKAYYAATDEERKLTTEGNKSAVGTDTKYFYFDPETTITDKWTILCYDAQGVYFVLENIPTYYSINVKVADDQSARGTVKPTVMNEINTLAYGTAKAESKDPQLYSFEKWGWKSSSQTEESFEFTSEIILHDSCQNTWPEIRVNAAGTDLMLIAHFKAREIVTIYFVDSENWGTNIRMHLWGGFEQGTTWPGIKPNETDLTCNGHKVYSYTFDKGAYEKVKWSNNGNDKSSNFIIDQELPYYNERDGRWYDALSSIGPDKTICAEWRVVFNNSDEYFKLVEGQTNVYECFLANVPAWEKEGDNWVKMKYKPSGDWEWRGFTSISNNQKVESYVSATYTASINNSDQNQLNLAGIAEGQTQDFVLTFNTTNLQLNISLPTPKVEIGVKDQEGTAITESDIDSEDGFLLNAYPQNVDKDAECTYSFQYQKDGGSWTTISGATTKSSTIMGDQLDGPGVYKFKVTMTISGQQYTSQETGNVTIYKYYWVAIKDNKNDNETSHWASYLHCWGPSGNKLAWPGESISNPTTGDLKTRDGWIYFRLKYPNYNKVLLTNGKTSDSGKDEVKTNDIEINPSAALCYKITGDQYWDESKQKSIWPTSTAGCPHRIFIDNDVNEYWMSVDGALSIAPKITYYGTGHLTYTWSTDATNLVLSATDKPNVSILASAVAAKATLTLTVTDGVDEKHYDFFINTQNGINIRVWKRYNDWTPVIRIWADGHAAEHHNMNNEGNGWYSYPVADSWTSVNFMVMKNDNSIDINLECTADVSGVTESGCWKVSTEQWENQKHKIDKTEDCGLYYRVEETLADGKTTYHSNKVKKANEAVSFYAAKDGKLALQHYDEAQGQYVDVKTLTNPAESNVQQATFTGNDITDMTQYEGDYYIRTDGAAGGWNDYRQAGNKFTSFTRNPLFGNEKYNYYWVTTIKDGKNAKAEVGNEINKCLAQTIGDYNCNQGAANVRFGYCPETNYFTRAIIAGSNVADYLTLYGDNSTYFNGGQDNSTLYTDEELTHKIYDGSQLKFKDLSDWVYEAEVYAAVDVTRPSDTKAVIKSKYHDQIDYLLGYDSENQRPSYAYTVLGNTSTKNMTFKITVTYDYKMNRLTTAWMPLAGVISGHLDVDAAIMFLNQVDVEDQVQQITVEDKNSDISSLNNIVYVMEFKETDDVKGQNKETNHWISLPFDCRISDIYGIEGYVTLNNNKMPTDGVWGIQRYDGATRATKGRMKETDTYWTWMGRDEELKAGEGYVLSFDRGAIDWPEIEGTRIKRLYFQSKTAGFTLNLSKEDATQEVAEHVENVSLHRYGEDANWNLIGPLAYNNITIKEWTGKKDAPKFLYEYLGKEATYIEGIGKYKLVNPLDNEPETEAPFQFHSFHSYMVQFAGDINWAQYTQTQQDNPATAPLMATADAEFTYTQVRLNLSKGAQLMDKTYVCLSATGTTGYDLNDDLSKITEAKANQLGSIVEGRIYAANTLPLETEMVTLYVNAASAGEYTIALSQENPYLEVKLFDAFEQTTTLLDLMPATVTLEKGEYKDRFFLQLTQKAPQSPTSLDGSLEQYNLPMDKTQKLLINGNIYLINAGRVYNATGAELR